MARLNLSQSLAVAFSLGLTLLVAPQNLVANASEVTTLTQGSTVQEPVPNNTPDSNSQPSNQAPNTNTNQATNERRDDIVYINEVYPEYCRSYFSRRDYVSLFEYRETMYRCLYGNDRFFWR